MSKNRSVRFGFCGSTVLVAVEWHPKLSHFEENLHPNLSSPNCSFCLIFQQGLVSTVDLSNAVKIAHAYSLNDESWRGMSEWQESEESLFGIFKGFLEIVVKPSKGGVLNFV